MHRPLVVLLVAAVCLSGAVPASARPLWKRRIDEVAAHRSMGVAVAHGGDLVYRRAARTQRVPASNQKLLTSMALLDALGHDARLHTWAAARRSRRGVVQGNLWILGRGDPAVSAGGQYARSLPFRPTWIGRIARAVAAAGVRGVRGAVVGSTGYFRHDWGAPGWKPEFRSLYIPLPTALTFDGNSHRGRNFVDPERRAARALTQRLEAIGIPVGHRPRAGHPRKGVRMLAHVRSQPLRKLLALMNHRSSNFFAEVLGKRLAVERYGAPGTIARAGRAIARWARSQGVRVVARDASGLSYSNRVSPGGLVRLLYRARREPWGTALRLSLPKGGRGTLEGRLAEVRVRAKTGTLDGVSALSGWVWQRRRGAWTEFSILSRGMPKYRAVALEDRIVRIIAGAGGRPRTRVATLAHRPLA